MKIDIVKSVIAVAIGTLLAYALYEICDIERVRLVICIGGFLVLTTPLLLAIGISAKEERGSIMLKTYSWVVFMIALIINFSFSFFDFSIPAYIIVNGLCIAMYALIYNSIYSKHM